MQRSIMWRAGFRDFSRSTKYLKSGIISGAPPVRSTVGISVAGEPINHAIDRFAGHDLLALWPGIHMAMDAGEIAKLADINLEDLRPGMAQGEGILSQCFGETVHIRSIYPYGG